MNTIEILKKTLLFDNMTERQIQCVLASIKTRTVQYSNNEMLLWEDNSIDEIGIILVGKARSIKADINGNIQIIMLLGVGSFVGIMLAASKRHKSPVSVQARGNTTVLYIPFKELTSCKGISDSLQQILIDNCFDCLAEQSMVLHDRIDCIVRSSVREKILVYLHYAVGKKNNKIFKIPLDRSEMAEYLGVDRSALSRELSRMKKDKIIDFHKNQFRLL